MGDPTGAVRPALARRAPLAALLLVLGVVAVAASSAAGPTAAGVHATPSDWGPAAAWVMLLAVCGACVIALGAALRGPGLSRGQKVALVAVLAVTLGLMVRTLLNQRAAQPGGAGAVAGEATPAPSAPVATAEPIVPATAPPPAPPAEAAPTGGRADSVLIALLTLAAVATAVVALAGGRRVPTGTSTATTAAGGAAASAAEVTGDPRAAVLAAYAQMCDELGRHGCPREAPDAPLEYMARAVLAVDTERASVVALTGLFERARFSDRPVSPVMRAEALRALRRVGQGLRAADDLRAGDELRSEPA